MASISGGAALEAALAKIAAGLEKGASVEVGLLEGATEDDGTPVALVAALNEFGHGKTPPRPFMRNAIAKNSDKWPASIAAALKANNYDAAVALDVVGQEIQEEIQDSIIETLSPPLSPVTVMLRGMRSNDPSLVVTGKTVGVAAARVAAGKTNYGASTKPLVDTGVMLRSVSHVVKS